MPVSKQLGGGACAATGVLETYTSGLTQYSSITACSSWERQGLSEMRLVLGTLDLVRRPCKVIERLSREGQRKSSMAFPAGALEDLGLDLE